MKELITAVEARIDELMVQAKKLGYSVKRPLTIFDVKGMTAGWMTSDGVMRINPELMKRNWDDYLLQTVGHEFAHHICYQMWPTLRISHGPEWKAVMVKLGLPPTRCHDYDVSEVKTRTLKTFEYACTKCGFKYELTSIRHNRILKGKTYHHPDCGPKYPLMFVRAMH